MDFTEQETLRAELREFTGSTEFYWHFTHAFRYTEGVKFLAERARIWWFLDLIASWQSRALQDPALREFQLWELRITEGKAVAVCLRDSEDEAFRQKIEFADSALDYVRLYLEGGTLLLPSEH
jgi:hypothetical protein